MGYLIGGMHMIWSIVSSLGLVMLGAAFGMLVMGLLQMSRAPCCQRRQAIQWLKAGGVFDPPQPPVITPPPVKKFQRNQKITPEEMNTVFDKWTNRG